MSALMIRTKARTHLADDGCATMINIDKKEWWPNQFPDVIKVILVSKHSEKRHCICGGLRGGGKPYITVVYYKITPNQAHVTPWLIYDTVNTIVVNTSL